MKGLLLHLQPCVPCRTTALQGERKAKTITHEGHSKIIKFMRKSSAIKNGQQPNKWENFYLKKVKR